MGKNPMNATGQDPSARFDPFTDRRSRDIRNGLSEALVEAIAANDQTVYHRLARRWLSTDLPPAFETYVRDRLKRYDRVTAAAESRDASRPFAGFIDIWNQELFFEAHEYLETIWQHTGGDRHLALKGLIKAAGVYVHLENNRRAAARRLAPRAYRQMKDHAESLGFIANLDRLLDCMQRVAPAPPRLKLNNAFDQS
jgi:hypothetical protein